MYQVSNPTCRSCAGIAGCWRAGARARASTARSSCSASPACSPTSRRRWSRRCCRSTSSTSAASRRSRSASSTASTTAPPRSSRLASGFIGDRWRRHKEVAAAGYGLSALCKLLLVAVGTAVSAIGAIVLLDRAGKGIRTAPRDAMISLSTPQEPARRRVRRAPRARHRPARCSARWSRSRCSRSRRWHSTRSSSSRFCLALLGLGILVLLVDGRARGRRRRSSRRRRRRCAARSGSCASRATARCSIAGGALSLATASDAFVFLALQDELDLGTSLFPLLFVGSAGTLHAARRADGPARRPRRPRPRAARRLRAAARGLRAAAARRSAAGRCSSPRSALLGALLRRDRRRADGARQRRRPRGGARQRPRAAAHATSLARLVASVAFGALWTCGASTPRSPCFGAALRRRDRARRRVALARAPEPAMS